MDTDVLVVGAGPTGLMASCTLAALGVDVRIVDGKAGPTRESRALGLQARSMEIYDQIGCGDRVGEEAWRATGLRPGYGTRMFGRVPFQAIGAGQTRFPGLYVLEQSRNERILVDRLAELGRRVEWERRFVGIRDLQSPRDAGDGGGRVDTADGRRTGDGAGVAVEVEDADGTIRTVTARYVVAADGASSPVRSARGIRFDGSTSPYTFCVIDVEGTEGLDSGTVNLRPAPRDLVLTFPMPGVGHDRVITAVPSADVDDSTLGHVPGSSVYGDRGLEERVRRRVRDCFGITWRSRSWFSPYRVHHRVAERFRDGPVFLAGDAAHVHSPVGAQGMNTGLQDAHNLAVALADVVRGGAADTELDRYERERRPVARMLVATTDRLFAAVTSQRLRARLVRRILPRVIGGPATVLIPGSRAGRRAFGYLAQLRVRYRMPGSETNGVRDTLIGRRLPWVPRVETAVHLPASAETRGRTVSGDGSSAPERFPIGGQEAEAGNFGSLRAMCWQVHEYGSLDPAAAQRLADTLEMPVVVFPAAPGTALVAGEYVLVRPDGYVTARSRDVRQAERWRERLPHPRILEERTASGEGSSPMRAVCYEEFGDGSVLHLGERDLPQAGVGAVRIRVHAASVNRADVKKRNGQMGAATFPETPGLDAAGVVDQVGEGVEGISIGDEVFGLGVHTHADIAVLSYAAHKPSELNWVDAAALPVVTETAERVLRLLDLQQGQTVLIEGASGGVGAAAVQLARARGARVIGTASERNHEYLASLGAEPILYGRGLVERVRGIAEHVDAVFDTAGSGSLPELVRLVDDPAQVVSIADFDAPEFGARATGGGADSAPDVLDDVGRLVREYGYAARVDSVFPLVDAAAAFDRVETGRPQGKVMLDVSLS